MVCTHTRVGQYAGFRTRFPPLAMEENEFVKIPQRLFIRGGHCNNHGRSISFREAPVPAHIGGQF